MAVVITLALGLRKLRAELRRRVEAWENLSSLAGQVMDEAPADNGNRHDELSQTPAVLQTQNRNTFHAKFKHWANHNGAETIRKLRWTFPTNQIAIQTLQMSAPFE